MRKGVHTHKFSRTSNERKQLFRNLVRGMVDHGFMVTTEAKAKAVRPQIEKLITTAKDDNLTAFRHLISAVGNVDTAKSLQKLGDLFSKRPGGYTRLIKLASQQGDNTALVKMEFVEKLVAPEIVTPKEVKPVEKKEMAKQIEAQTPKIKSAQTKAKSIKKKTTV